jgi:hypothetical protein
MTFIPFLNRGERDVGQQGREDPALGCPGIRTKELLLRQDPGLQEGQHQARNLAVSDAPTHSLHQCVMVDIVEAPLDVPFDCPLVREPSFRLGFPWS